MSTKIKWLNRTFQNPMFCLNLKKKWKILKKIMFFSHMPKKYYNYDKISLDHGNPLKCRCIKAFNAHNNIRETFSAQLHRHKCLRYISHYFRSLISFFYFPWSHSSVLLCLNVIICIPNGGNL